MKVYFHFYNCFICVPLVMAQLAILYFIIMYFRNSYATSQLGYPNVGTVLFYKDQGSEGVDECWLREQLSLLRCRRILQELLPTNLIDLNHEQSVLLLIKYFDHAFKIAKRNIQSDPNSHLIAEAMADTIGGYLKFWALPLARFGYYAGTVSYESAKNISDYYSDIKENLNTDGYTWRSPDFDIFKVLDINVVPTPSPVGEPRHQRQACKDVTFLQTGASSESRIPMPHINWDYKPHMMVVPLESKPLIALESPAAAYILYDYYTTADNCLTAKQTWKDREDFRDRFHRWAVTEVLPRLNDDTLYIGFGSILRLINGTGDWVGGTFGGSYPLRYPIPKNMMKNVAYLGNSQIREELKCVLKKSYILLGALAILWCGPCLFYCYFRNKKPCLSEEPSDGEVSDTTALMMTRSHCRQQYKRAEHSYPCEVLYSGRSKPSDHNASDKSSFDDTNKSSNYKSKTSELLLKVSRANSVNFIKEPETKVWRNIVNAKASIARCSSVKVDKSTQPGKSTTHFQMDLKEIEADNLNQVLNYLTSACTKSDDLVSGDLRIEMPSSLSTIGPGPNISVTEVSQIPSNKTAHSTPDVSSQSTSYNAKHFPSPLTDTETQESSTGKQENARPSRIPQKRQSTLTRRILPADGK